MRLPTIRKRRAACSSPCRPSMVLRSRPSSRRASSSSGESVASRRAPESSSGSDARDDSWKVPALPQRTPRVPARRRGALRGRFRRDHESRSAGGGARDPFVRARARLKLHPIVVFLLDGVADRAHESLGGKTGVEAARTPNLDALCSHGSCGVIYAIGPGRAPSSEVAHWSMLGYRPDEFPGRAVFEALGRGQQVSAEHVFAYAALRPAERRHDGWWLTGRPDAQRDAEEAERLIERCDGIEIDGMTFSLQHIWRGEAVLRIAGGADERVTDTDAFFRARHPLLRPQPLVSEAERTARAAEEWTREVMRRLDGERFNVIMLKWWGRPHDVPSFEQRHGVTGTFVAESAFLRGLARTVGLHTIELEETDDAAADLRARVQLVRERLDAGDTFVLVH